MAVSKKEIKHIAHLARLNLSDKELESFTKEIGDILDYVDQLRQVRGQIPSQKNGYLKNVLRHDLVLEKEQKLLLEQKHQTEKGYLKIPLVFNHDKS